jgi:hypothetical protein
MQSIRKMIYSEGWRLSARIMRLQVNFKTRGGEQYCNYFPGMDGNPLRFLVGI